VKGLVRDLTLGFFKLGNIRQGCDVILSSGNSRDRKENILFFALLVEKLAFEVFLVIQEAFII